MMPNYYKRFPRHRRMGAGSILGIPETFPIRNDWPMSQKEGSYRSGRSVGMEVRLTAVGAYFLRL